MTVETWLHFLLTTHRCFWAINFSWKLEIIHLQKKLQNIFQAISTLIIYPIIFIASIECTDSSILTGKNIYCTTFKLCGLSRTA